MGDFRADLSQHVDGLCHPLLVKEGEGFVKENELSRLAGGRNQSLRKCQPHAKHELAMRAVGNLREADEVVLFLAKHSDALRRTSEQSEKQTQAIAATEMNARQETFFKIADNVARQLGGITGMLFMSGLGPAGSGRYDREEMDAFFQNASNGDHEIFARQFLTMDYLKEGGLPELLYGTEIRRKHCRNFRRTFERLLKFAEGCDVDGIIVDSMLQTGFGLLYNRMEHHRPSELPPDED